MASDWDVPLSQFRRRSTKRQRISSQAHFPISKLGAELLAEILIRLPNPRSACRCKLVCKRWDSLISSTCFNRRFVSHQQTMNHPPMPLDPQELKSSILSFLPPMPCTVGDALRVLDCNKDLVLCGFWDIGCDDGERSRTYLVCNPFTKQWIALPLAPRKHGRYMLPAARLVCETRNSNKLDLGGEQAFVYSEYSFRVVCIYQVALPIPTIKLDVFCSESGEWTKEALICVDHVRTGSKSVVSCNGEMFWKYFERRDPLKVFLAVFNPFRLDMPPTSIDVSAFLAYPRWFISASQGALHVIAIENKSIYVHPSIWRLEQDRKSWMIQCKGLVDKTSDCGNYEVEGCYQPFLHPHKPEIFFFNPIPYRGNNAILCCDLGREKLEFIAKVEGRSDVFYLQVFQPRVSCWATPIPRYEDLRGMYDGSCSFWVQRSSEVKTDFLLYNCMDGVMKSAFYEDYIELVTREVSLKMVAQIMQRRMNKIRDIVVRSRPQHPFPLDKEFDVLEPDLKDVEAEVAAIGKRKEELKQKLVCKTTAVLPYPSVSIENVSAADTPNMVAEINLGRKRKMVLTERQQPRFPHDKEANMESYIREPKKLKHRLLCETSAKLHYSPVSIKSVSAEITPNISSRKRKIRRMVLRERQQPRFPDDNETDLKDVEFYGRYWQSRKTELWSLV